MTSARRLVSAAVVAAVLFCASAAWSQDFTGQWRGTVQDPAQPRRVVIRVVSQAGTLRVTLYSIDRAPQPYAGTLTISGSSARMLIPSIDGTFDAKLSADGTELSGSYAAQGVAGVPLTLKRRSSHGSRSLITSTHDRSSERSPG